METCDRIKALRKQKNLSQAQLGDLVGCSASAISCYELGKRSPDYETLLSIAEELSTSAQYLLTGNPGGMLLPEDEELTVPADSLSPAKQKLIDSLDGLTDEQIKRLLVVIETAKAIL